MDILEFTIVILMGSMLAGFLGALTGLGGGVVIVPFLSLVLGTDIRYAIGASLVSVIATSSGSAAAYVKEGFSNIRIGLFLEMATTMGALIGAGLAGLIPVSMIAVIFGLVLLYSAGASIKPRHVAADEEPPDFISTQMHMNGTYPTEKGERRYTVHAIPAGFSLMFVAGGLSGLLGIGSGAVKVLAMDRVMRIPFKVSTTTSNFMIGVTAAASAGVYLNRGYIDPGLAMPVTLGVLVGSMLGSRAIGVMPTRVMRFVFAAVVLILGFEMIYNGLTGRF
jgi:uncharacterized protein